MRDVEFSFSAMNQRLINNHLAVSRTSFAFQNIFRELIYNKFAQSELAVHQFTQRQVLLVFLLCKYYFHSLLADVSFN